MAKKSLLEKEIKKRVHPLIIFIFIVFVIIGFLLGYYVKNKMTSNEYNNYKIETLQLMKGDIL